MKIIKFKSASADEAREYISNLEVESLNEGDKAEVTLPDGSKQIYVLKTHWEDEETGKYVIAPDNG